MLTQEQLTEALHAALKAAQPPCARSCVAGIEIDGSNVHVWHNGIGDPPGADQVIYAEAPLGWPVSKLASRLQVWVEGQHRHEFVDLNAAMETGGWIEGGPCLMRLDQHGPNTVILPNLVRTVELNMSDFDDASGRIEYYTSYPLGVVVTAVGFTPCITTAGSPNVNMTWRWSDGTAP